MYSLARNALRKFATINNVGYVCPSNMVWLGRTQCYTCLCVPSNLKLVAKACDISGKQQIHSDEVVHNVLHYIRKFKKYSSDFTKKLVITNYMKFTEIGFTWYQTLDTIDYLEFFRLLKMPDTFYSWYKVTELHVWMLLFKLMQDGEGFSTVRKGVMEALWVDVENRAKLVEEVNLNYKKNMHTLSEKFKMTLFTYDEGFLSNDITLANALWDKFFDQDLSDPRCLEILISYIRYQVNHMQHINTKINPNEKNLQKLIMSKNIWTPLKPHLIGER